ncbi:hypothetical protein LCGC14_0495290 [marine sediment metagenome]|uniref:Uncharacterized protein n=1 Tax=marine sediment metagenome TaxID=412755 RepID=A0A0F9SNY6_9ZZZZ|nr:hypothetical protein [bacterium]
MNMTYSQFLDEARFPIKEELEKFISKHPHFYFLRMHEEGIDEGLIIFLTLIPSCDECGSDQKEKDLLYSPISDSYLCIKCYLPLHKPTFKGAWLSFQMMFGTDWFSIGVKNRVWIVENFDRRY